MPGTYFMSALNASQRPHAHFTGMHAQVKVPARELSYVFLQSRLKLHWPGPSSFKGVGRAKLFHSPSAWQLIWGKFVLL